MMIVFSSKLMSLYMFNILNFPPLSFFVPFKVHFARYSSQLVY